MAVRYRKLEIPAVSEQPELGLRSAVANALGIDEEHILALNIHKKSLDARKKSRIVYRYQVDLELADEQAVRQAVGEDLELLDETPDVTPLGEWEGQTFSTKMRPLVIGSGPAGIFAAQILTEAGLKPIVIERGEPVEKRLKTVGKLRRSGEFSGESNYCYGEGGAGTFSDGKLTCGRNHPLVRYLFREWVRFGAPDSIMYDAHPHIGTDHLMVIAKRTREYLQSKGATFLFGARLEDVQRSGDRELAITLNDGQVLRSEHVVLAVGHSARETYRMLHDRGLAMAPKPFALGARFEHPQEVIDRIQFGSCNVLPPAEYKLAAKAGDRGIWTFCMCPGGHLLSTGAQPGHLAINGMSYHARNSGFANAAVVVNIRREDFYKGHVLDGLAFQEDLEKAAFAAGGGDYRAPAQRLDDFLIGRESQGTLTSTYQPGVVSARMDAILPEFVSQSLRGALHDYNKRMRGFLSKDALVVGLESKTSAPVMMTRDPKTLMSVSHPGLFPCGEGAGFAGGIVSAALDGARVGRAVIQSLL